jgi:hypothetical protein
MEINTQESTPELTFSPSERVLSALIVTTLPPLAFLGAAFFDPTWQSGQIVDYVNLLLQPSVAMFFFPFVNLFNCLPFIIY